MAGSRVGVLALQGAFAAHLAALARVGADAREVRSPGDLDAVDSLVIPGGESTTIGMLLDSAGLRAPIAQRLAAGMPVFGTCAGLVLLASGISDGVAGQHRFAALDVDVRRNAYGRQRESFEADLTVPALGEAALRAVFIRAPAIERVGPEVEVLAAHDGVPVLVRQDSVLACSFHPELTGDVRLHRYFVGELAGDGAPRAGN